MKPELEQLLRLYDELPQADNATAAHIKPVPASMSSRESRTENNL